MKKQFEKIRLIVCDIDGTLYDWDRILSKRTIRVINELHDRGYGQTRVLYIRLPA